MTSTPIPLIVPTGQASDTLSVSKVVPVVTPTAPKINLKVETTAIKSFDFERENETLKKFHKTVVSRATTAVPDRSVVDTLSRVPDISVYWQGANVEVPGVFYPSLPQDSVSLLTYGNYFGKGLTQNEPSEGHSHSGDSIQNAQKLSPKVQKAIDPQALKRKTSQWVETLVGDQPEVRNSGQSTNFVLNQEWFLSLIILSVAITGILRLKWARLLKWIFNSVFFTGVTSQVRSERFSHSRGGSFGLGVLFILNISLFIFEALSLHGRVIMGLDGWRLLALVMALLMGLFVSKVLAYLFVGWVFRKRDEVNSYLFQSGLMSKVYGMILVPVVVFFPFANDLLRHWLLGVGIGVFILLYVMQIGRGIINNFRDLGSGYYIILYLCALEILPLSILYRVLLY